MTTFTVAASEPLYQCWKRAINATAFATKTLQLTRLYPILEREYGCKTVNAQISGANRFVELEFASEQHATLFMLRWA